MTFVRTIGLLLLTLMTGQLDAQPRSPLPQSYVSDESGLLAADTVRELNRLAATLDDKQRGEIAFLIVRSTGGVDPRRFGAQAFNAWRVGDRQLNNGTLFLLALDDRATEIILGSGIDDGDYTRMANNVMHGEILPRFRQGDFDQGLVAGATAWLQRAYQADLSRPAEAATEPEGDTELDRSAAASAETTATTETVPLSQPTRQPRPTTTPEPQSNIPATVIGVGIIGSVIAAVGWLLYKFLSLLWWFIGSRLVPRTCSRCSGHMTLLSEAQDDAHLTPQQITEEILRSVDHRVFHCPGCGHVEKLVRAAWFSRFMPCATCGSKAVSSTSRTVSSATRYSTGLLEITSTCQHCGAASTSQSVIPRITSSSSSTSWSSSSSRSFGGGSSRGGGASGRF